MKAFLKNYRQSPRKVRLVAGLIRGKSVARAKTLLAFADQKSAPAILKLLNSAVVNAQTAGKDAKDLIIKEIMVDEGIVMKRFMPMARGRANPYKKRSSRITLALGEKTVATKKTAKK